MGRTPSREERHAAAALALRPYGFVLDPGKAQGLRNYQPFALFSSPVEYVTGAFGEIEGARVEAYEYRYSAKNRDGKTTRHDMLVVAIHHPWVEGGVTIAPADEQWGGAAAVLDTLLWIPPFTLVKVLQQVMESKSPDRTVGDAEFDRLYRVHATSDEAARRAVPPPLREVCLRLAFRGEIELRPGLLLYRPPQRRLDGATAVPAIGLGAAFLAAFAAPASAHPMR